MTIQALERLPSLKEMNPFRKRHIADSLASTALAPEITPIELPVVSRIEAIKQMPPEMIDRQLSNLIALTHDERLVGDTEEIPAVLTDAIHDTAEKLVDTWGLDDHTYMSVMALTDAYAITHDEHLIETAVDVVHATPHFVDYLPKITEAVELSAETGEDFHTAIKHVSGDQRDISIPVRSSASSSDESALPTSFLDQEPMETYDYLFHPTIKRPETPEYTSGGIHPSLRPKNWD
jgi:hypothetical protein